MAANIASRPERSPSLSDSTSITMTHEHICEGTPDSQVSAEKKTEDTSDSAGPTDVPRDEKRAQGGQQRATADAEYPSGIKLFTIFASLILAAFLVALDRTIVSTAIPAITNEFHSTQDIGWYGSAFLLPQCALQLLIGRIYTFTTPKYVFLVFIALFEVGSLVCAVAPNSIAFIFGRAIAGAGSAGITAGAIIVMISLVPLPKRPMYQGYFGATFAIASVVGPLIGGAFTSGVTWRWAFYINLPLGGVAICLLIFVLQRKPPVRPGLSIRQRVGQLDVLGQSCLVPSMVCLHLALEWGGSEYAWSNGRIIALLVLFAVLLLCYAAVQVWRPKTASLPMRFLTNRSALGSMWFTFCFGSAMILVLYYLPLWFQGVQGVSAVQSGIRTIPLVLSLALAAIAAGRIVGAIGYYVPMMLLSCALMPVGAGLLTTLQVHTGAGSWIGYQVLFGLGVGLGQQQGLFAMQTVLDKLDVPVGVSLIYLSQTLGASIFVSVGQNLYSSALATQLGPGAVLNTGATTYRHSLSGARLSEVLDIYNHALRRTFIAATVLGSIAILGAALVEWRSVKGEQGPSVKPQSSSSTERDTRS